MYEVLAEQDLQEAWEDWNGVRPAPRLEPEPPGMPEMERSDMEPWAPEAQASPAPSRPAIEPSRDPPDQPHGSSDHPTPRPHRAKRAMAGFVAAVVMLASGYGVRAGTRSEPQVTTTTASTASTTTTSVSAGGLGFLVGRGLVTVGSR
jgi:hypothetical protein